MKLPEKIEIGWTTPNEYKWLYEKINEILLYLEERDKCCNETADHSHITQESPKEKEWRDCGHNLINQNCDSCIGRLDGKLPQGIKNKPELNVRELLEEYAANCFVIEDITRDSEKESKRNEEIIATLKAIIAK